jgi:hypothetical protein
MWMIFLSFMLYLYYCFFFAYGVICETYSSISFVHDYAIRSAGAVMSLFSLNWNSNTQPGFGLPWLGHVSAPMPIAPNFFAFSFSFCFGVLAYLLCVVMRLAWDIGNLYGVSGVCVLEARREIRMGFGCGRM